MTQADFHPFFDDDRRDDRRLVFADLERHAGHPPFAAWHEGDICREVVVWCSNDPLGMGSQPNVINAMIETALRAGAGGARDIAGGSRAVATLEAELAGLHRKEAALVFGSGYAVNEAALGTIGHLLPECLFLSDEKNDGSIAAGINAGGAEGRIFRHNDHGHLERLLAASDCRRPKIIAFASLYPMDGDIAPIARICDLATKYGALTYLDEGPAVGLYGLRGAGIAERDGAMNRIDIIAGTLADGFGVAGGYIAARARVCEALRCTAAAFDGTAALSPPVAAAATQSIRHLKNSVAERVAHRLQVDKTRRALRKAGIPAMPSTSHIIAVPINDRALCHEAAMMLLERFGIYLPPMGSPTVTKGSERLCVTPTPFHNDRLIARLAHALREVWQALDLPLETDTAPIPIFRHLRPAA
jgi:5-aminolevulinate synthase